MSEKPFVLTIAGFDPSGGAGLLADIKTIEANGCYGLAVQTANTIQTEDSFLECLWVDNSFISKQLKTLLERYEISAVKIGIVQSKTILLEILQLLKTYIPNAPVVLDPVLKSSSGYNFHYEAFLSEEILKNITVLTPNYDEILQLSEKKELNSKIETITNQTNLFLKGGHHPSEKGKDRLYLSNGQKFDFYPSEEKIYEKHGSGCILSAAMASYLANGETLENTCEKAKKYTEKALCSNTTKLAYHL
ncbi:hydroxymethylpyrimidine/phosphomethylpyrimidine kinase [Galbibacter mesophilus]|uniref:hydroxymethylpyrimidine/phosphomethylpyrimidine kinase n=1 Tax=Galbibacter mesophilus TaxID=379069 RepID=UPI00191F616F|nr:hydroxymethylpyrimidine/phosphomethylpyrimidine kinase [Galbibacter mesophilus]MCM5662063.1 hydroxymethylpyrimidine/phosphomethylpyrimidine kinase [Galbibacter mesophilus]